MTENQENNIETTIEGAQKRMTEFIEFWADHAKFIGDPQTTRPDLEYIAVFLDSVGDEMAAITSSYNSLHARYVEAVAAIDEWESNFEAVEMASSRRLEEKIELQKEIDKLKAQADIDKATINSLNRQLLAAHDNR